MLLSLQSDILEMLRIYSHTLSVHSFLIFIMFIRLHILYVPVDTICNILIVFKGHFYTFWLDV